MADWLLITPMYDSSGDWLDPGNPDPAGTILGAAYSAGPYTGYTVWDAFVNQMRDVVEGVVAYWSTVSVLQGTGSLDLWTDFVGGLSDWTKGMFTPTRLPPGYTPTVNDWFYVSHLGDFRDVFDDLNFQLDWPDPVWQKTLDYKYASGDTYGTSPASSFTEANDQQLFEEIRLQIDKMALMPVGAHAVNDSDVEVGR